MCSGIFLLLLDSTKQQLLVFTANGVFLRKKGGGGKLRDKFGSQERNNFNFRWLQGGKSFFRYLIFERHISLLIKALISTAVKISLSYITSP